MTAPVPALPATMADTGLRPIAEQLLMKTLYGGEATGAGLADRMCLPFSRGRAALEGLALELLIEVRGASAGTGSAGYRYA